MRIALRTIMLLFPLIFMGRVIGQAQSSETHYDFVPGDSTLFDDRPLDALSSAPSGWKILGGKASVILNANERCVSIDQYYTKMSPKMKSKSVLGKRWTIEFDTWLAAGYDGNPGVSLIFMGKAEIAHFTPNRDEFSLTLGSNRVSTPTPASVVHELYYDRWHHIELQFEDNVLKVFCNHEFVLSSPAWNQSPTSLLLVGDASSNMSMLFKNFRIANGGGRAELGTQWKGGRYISHALHFEVGQSTLLKSSETLLNDIADKLKEVPESRYEIQGHTDSDGNAQANMILSQARADAVKAALIQRGVAAEQLISKGYGSTKALVKESSVEAKAQNRRVEFIRL